jgi:hypothetical protein
MNAARQFFRRSRRERRLFVEALLWLAWAKLLVHAVPFRRIAPRLGRTQAETAATVSAADRALAVEISWAVQAAARHVRFGFVCLPQAMAAQRMLRRRRIATTLYFGVSPDHEKKDAIASHAWLRAGDKIVTGQEQMHAHRPLAWFADWPDGA